MEKLLNKRESNFELLRIISMLFIIAAHYALYNGFSSAGSLASNFLFSFFRCGGKLGVTLFILITGYFMVHSDIKIKKVIILECQVLFYTIGALLFCLLMGREVTYSQLIQSFLPNLLRMYWFFSSYFALYLFIPLINKFVLGLKRDEFKKLLLLSLVFLIVIPTFFIYFTPIHDGIYLVYYYMVGCYIKLHFKEKRNKWFYLLMFVGGYLSIVLLSTGMNYLSIGGFVPSEYIYYYAKNGSIFLFVTAISLFLFFKNIKINYNKLINRIASVSFGVYLFHDNIFFREILWEEIFVMNSYANIFSYFITGVGTVIIVYLIGRLIDWFRQVISKG